MAGDETGAVAAADELFTAVAAAAEPVEWMTFGLTFCMLGSGGEVMTAAGVVCGFTSVRA